MVLYVVFATDTIYFSLSQDAYQFYFIEVVCIVSLQLC